jgi:DNA-binding NtrC family response regulator
MLLEIEHPDLVLLDLRMPGLGGLEVLRRIRMVRPDLPVIIISGLGDADTARQTLRRGAVDYLPKPFDLDHVLRAIAAALGRGWSENARSGAQANTA